MCSKMAAVAGHASGVGCGGSIEETFCRRYNIVALCSTAAISLARKHSTFFNYKIFFFYVVTLDVQSMDLAMPRLTRNIWSKTRLEITLELMSHC